MFIEKAFEVLKRRFPLLKHGVRLQKAKDNCLLILSAFGLHNMCIFYKNEGDFNFEEDDEIQANDQSDDSPNHEQTDRGIDRREAIARSFL